MENLIVNVVLIVYIISVVICLVTLAISATTVRMTPKVIGQGLILSFVPIINTLIIIKNLT